MSEADATRLTDMDAITYLTKQGFEVNINLIRYWRQVTIGPSYFRVGRRVFYRRTDIDAWAQTDHARQYRPRTVSIA